MINLIDPPYQFTTLPNWPFYLRLGGRYGFAFLNLPGGLAIAWNLENEPEERTVWQFSRLTLTRLETEEELAEQEFRELQDWQDLQASIPDAAERNRNLC